MSDSDATLIGIDGGGTRTRFILAKQDGTICALVHGGPLNPNNVREDDLRQRLADGFAQLLPQTERMPSAPAQVYAGVAGIKTAEEAADFGRFMSTALALDPATIQVANDTELVLAGGLLGRPGAALIVGTGSHCLARNEAGMIATCGGWGCLLDDCGSGYAIGHTALRTAARMWDGRLARTGLADAVMCALDIDQPEKALRRVYNTGFGFMEINALAPVVMSLAERGDDAAQRIVREAMDAAGELVEVATRKLAWSGPLELVVTGGVIEQSYARALLAENVAKRIPGGRLVRAALPPLAGAVLRAAQRGGAKIDDAFVQRLSESLRAIEQARQER